MCAMSGALIKTLPYENLYEIQSLFNSEIFLRNTIIYEELLIFHVFVKYYPIYINHILPRLRVTLVSSG